MNNEKKVMNLQIDDILPNRFQPRFKFQEQAITELAESIREHGVINPILVRQLGDKFEIIAGERRYKASVLAGKETIPAIVTDLNDKESAEIALIENVQRQDLTPIEEAVSYRKILDMGYLTQEQLAEKLGKTQSTISNKLRLLNLADEVQEALLDTRISERHARSLLKISDKKLQKDVLNQIITRRLTVKKTDELIKNLLVESGATQAIPEPAIQSSSAVEFIEPQSQNAFNPSQTSDDDMLSFLSTNQEQQVIAPIPEEEIPIIPINQINGFNANNQPDRMDIQDINTPESDLSKISKRNEQQLMEINQMLDAIPNKINPGFADVDYIKQNAKDITISPEPIPAEETNKDLENNLLSQNVISADQLTNLQNSEQIDINTIMQAGNQEPTFEPQNPIENDYKQNKFFNFVAPDETPVEPTTPEEIFNLKPQIETVNTMNDFLSPSIPTEQPQPTEQNATPIVNEETKEIEQPQSVEQKENDVKEDSAFDIFNQPTITPAPVQQPETNLNEFYNPDSTENTKDLSLEMEEIDEPKEFNYTQDHLAASSVNDKLTMTSTIEQSAEGGVSPINLKTVINTIRSCSDTIEKYGFEIETEEYDFEDLYQVIFKIKK